MTADLTHWETKAKIQVECKIDEPDWMKRGLQQTHSGYGNRLMTRYKVRIGCRWRRVYCACFSNAGTCYVGKPGNWLYTVNDVNK